MNALRLRILMFMLVIGLTPLTLMTFGLRFLPGPMLPWILYALLASTVIVVSVAMTGALSGPLNRAADALTQLMRTHGAHRPKAWVPEEFWELRDSLLNAMADVTAERATLEQQLADKTAAVAAAELAAVRGIEVLHAVVNASTDAVVFVHAEGHVTLINQRTRELFALPEEMRKPGAQAEAWFASLCECFKDELLVKDTWEAWQRGAGSQEAEFETTDNRLFAVSSLDVRTEVGRLLGRVWTFRDVTEQREFAERLQEAQKLGSVGQLAGGIAHDFNNLLTAIRGNLAMADLVDNREEYRDKIENASRAATRATELVGQILGYSRRSATAGTTTNTEQVVSEVRNILKAGLDPKVRLACHVPKDIWTAAADPTQVEQVLLNLCINARDALPPTGGTIDISLANLSLTSKEGDEHSAGDYVLIKVKDNGSGMSAEVRERLFEPFFTTKAHGKGTGLGLAMALGIVEQFGGWIEFDSEPGKGTEFRVFLPRCKAVPVPPPEEKPKADTRTLRGKVEGTVLVVDDEAPVRSIAVSMLRYLGYRVIEAEDGEEAINILRTSSLPIDAMLMDVYMPKLSGRDTFKQLRALGIDIPVIVCSGFMVEAAEFNALSQGRHGLMDVIQKPYSMETLASVIGQAVSKGHQALAA